MALGTLELEASAPYPTLITQTLVPPKHAWPVQQLMESTPAEKDQASVEKQQEVASRLKQQAVASTLNLTMKQDSFAENPQSSDLLLPHIIDMPWANSVEHPLQTKLPGSRQARLYRQEGEDHCAVSLFLSNAKHHILVSYSCIPNKRAYRSAGKSFGYSTFHVLRNHTSRYTPPLSNILLLLVVHRGSRQKYQRRPLPQGGW